MVYIKDISAKNVNTPSAKPPRIFNPIMGNGGLFDSLVAVLEKCETRFTYGCRDCPHIAQCTFWWDKYVAEYCAFRILHEKKFLSYLDTLERIRAGKYGGTGRK